MWHETKNKIIIHHKLLRFRNSHKLFLSYTVLLNQQENNKHGAILLSTTEHNSLQSSNNKQNYLSKTNAIRRITNPCELPILKYCNTNYQPICQNIWRKQSKMVSGTRLNAISSQGFSTAPLQMVVLVCKPFLLFSQSIPVKYAITYRLLTRWSTFSSSLKWHSYYEGTNY